MALSGNRDEFRFLLSLANLGPVQHMYSLVRSKRKEFDSLKHQIPGMSCLLAKYESIENHLNSDSKYVDDQLHLSGMNYYSIRPETTAMIKEFKALFRPVQKWAKTLLDTTDKMMREGMVNKPRANPNKNGKHYRLALLATSKLQHLWFVKRIILFGSTAAGTEKPDSDVDIAIELFVKQTVAVSAVEGTLDSLSREYNVAIPPLFMTPSSPKRFLSFMDSAGFWEASEELFSRDNWILSFDTDKDNNIYTVLPQNLADVGFKQMYVRVGDSEHYDTYACLLIKNEHNNCYRYLFFRNNEPLLLGTRPALMIPRSDCYALTRYFRLPLIAAKCVLSGDEKEFISRLAADIARKNGIVTPVICQDIRGFATSCRRSHNLDEDE